MMSFKNIRPGGYVRSGLARMSISFYNKLSGDSWFLQNREHFLFYSFGTELPLIIWPLMNGVTICSGARKLYILIIMCVCVGRCREESILKFSETFVFRYIIRPMSDIPTQKFYFSRAFNRSPIFSNCLWPAALSVVISLASLLLRWCGRGDSLHSSFPISLLQRRQFMSCG